MAAVLVVDDSDVVRETLFDVLSDAGHEVLLAQDYEGARARCEQGGVDIVICDVMLPAKLGAKGSRGQPSAEIGKNTIPELALDFPSVPIVAFSGFLSSHELEAMKGYGAVAVLSKPCSNQLLLDAISRVLRQSH